MTSGRIILLVYACGYGVALSLACLFPAYVRLIGITTSYHLRDPLRVGAVVLAAMIPLLGVEIGVWLCSRSRSPAMQQKKSAVLDPWVLVTVSGCLLLVMFLQATDYGWRDVMARPYYLESHYNYSGFGALRWMLIVVPVIAGHLTAVSPTRRLALLCLIPAVFFLILQFSYGSRQLPLGILLFAVTYYRGIGRLPRPHVAVLLIALVLYSYNCTLKNRSDTDHGLIPYSLNLTQGLADLSDVAVTLTDFVSVLDATLADYRPTREEYLVAINPLPGMLAGWPEIGPRLKLHPFVPYCALGELGARGLLTVAGHFLVIGLVLFAGEWGLTRIFRRPDSLGHFYLRMFSLAFAVFSLQYNLRSSTRMLYYGLFFALVSAVVGLAFSRIRLHITLGERRLI